MYYDQHEYELRCEWGENGLKQLAAICDVLIIVDVLSFTTAVDVAVSRGAIVFPFPYKDERSQEYARTNHALLAGSKGVDYGLSPSSLLGIPSGTRLVLPSPNGSHLSRLAGKVTTLAGCLRNADAVARAAQTAGRVIGVVPAGERWADQSLRAGLEDLLGAGAILRMLPGSRSPEAELAIAALQHFEPDLSAALSNCSSGKELIGRGRPQDVALAAELNCSATVPWLTNGIYQRRL